MDVESAEPESSPNIDFRGDQEEWWNFTTHAIGFVLACVGFLFLLPSIEGKPAFVRLVTWVYGTTMVALYASSALSHYYHRSPLRSLFRKLDQALIFIFIVSGFTPYFAVDLTEVWAWTGVGLLWLTAIIGFSSKLFFGHRIEGIATWTYLALGWLPAVGMPFADSLPLSTITFITTGGVVYTLGVVILMSDHKAWYYHCIWHVLVMLGSGIHYWGIQHCLQQSSMAT